MRPVAFPAFKALGSVVTRAVAIVVDHVEDVALRPFLRHCVFIVRTVDIKVVVYAHVDVVIPTVEPGRQNRRQEEVNFYSYFQRNDSYELAAFTDSRPLASIHSSGLVYL